MSALTRMAPRVSMTGRQSSTARLSAVKRHLSTSQVAMSTPNNAGAVTDSVLYESDGPARIYKLNRPKALNALDMDMVQSLAKEVNTWRTSDNCKLVIGRGDERAFCAGGDVKSLVEGRPTQGAKPALSFFQEEFEMNWEMGRLGKPYVAIIDGFTMGGGAGISLPAQIRIATKKTVFAMPETKIGYSPDVGGNYYIAQLDGQIGAWLAITGQETWGRACYELGIATHYVAPEVIPDLVRQLGQLEDPTPEQVSALVANYHVPEEAGLAPSSKASREGPSPVRGEIRKFLDEAFGKNSIQEIYAALKAGEESSSLPKEVVEWAAAQRKHMDERSPTGMAVALENFRLTQKAKRLATTLENDIRMATGFAGTDRATEDFSIGVTHLLIDKAKGRAGWQPASLEDKLVTPESIRARFFDPKATHLQETPKLAFKPEPETKEGHDHTWGQFRRFGLPAEATVKEWVKGENPQAGAFKVNEKELVQRMLDATGDAAGPRAKEIEARIKDIVARHTKKDADGYLDWVN